MYGRSGSSTSFGITSRTRFYRMMYTVTRPLTPLLKRIPGATTTEVLGRAMINVARSGAPKRILEGRDINEVGAA